MHFQFFFNAKHKIKHWVRDAFGYNAKSIFRKKKKNQCYCEFCEATMSDVVSPGDWSQFFFHWVSFQKHT